MKPLADDGYVRPTMVLVTWRDSVAGHGWRDHAEWDEWLLGAGAVQESVGFLYRLSAEAVVLMQSAQRAEPGAQKMDEAIEIPAPSVIEISVLTPGRRMKVK